jgi:hypothetical protein
VRLVMGRRAATQLALVGPWEPMGEPGLPMTFIYLYGYPFADNTDYCIRLCGYSGLFGVAGRPLGVGGWP